MEPLSNEVKQYPKTDREFKTFVYSQSPQEQARLLENAAKAGDIETIQQLFKLNVDPNVRSRDYWEGALYVACKYNQFKAAKILLDHNAHTARVLKLMIYQSRFNSVKFLLEHKANPNELSVWNRINKRPLHLTTESNVNAGEIAQLLIEHKADILMKPSTNNRSPFEYAIDRKILSVVKVMVAHSYIEVITILIPKLFRINIFWSAKACLRFIISRLAGVPMLNSSNFPPRRLRIPWMFRLILSKVRPPASRLLEKRRQAFALQKYRKCYAGGYICKPDFSISCRSSGVNSVW